MPGRLPIAFTYVLPLRQEAPADGGLSDYVRWVATKGQLVIVDGSPSDVFASHHEQWAGIATHIAPDEHAGALNGKVAGVLTGIRLAVHEAIVIGDDDVRYDDESLALAVERLARAHVVRPQNYFDPLPWHAAWDSGRILLNRALGGDWPGTLVVRRSAMRATNGYASNVLFENLELVRTVIGAGGIHLLASDVFVRRRPPSVSRFWSQRTRQAYDEFARPPRLAIQLAILPAAMTAAVSGHWPFLAAALIGAIVMAEIGRRRNGATRVFPFAASLFAPVWVVERGVCAWLAVTRRVARGGIDYSNGPIVSAATTSRELRRRYAGAITSTSIGLNDPLFDSSAEQAVIPTI